MKAVIIQTTTSSKKEAKKIAQILLEKKLAACIQILKIESMYTWENRLHFEKERLLFIKTKKKYFKKIKRKIEENHSYDLPEIVATDITNINKRYLKFIGENI